MKRINFEKYHGNGNDFIIIDSRNNEILEIFLSNKLFKISNLCQRQYGIGADGVIFIANTDDYNNDAKMIIYNSDDSEAEMCGNGIRCLIKYLSDQSTNNFNDHVFKIETKAGLKIGRFVDGQITVKMGKPILNNHQIPTKINNFEKDLPSFKFNYKEFSCLGYAVGMGNPHLIFFVNDLDQLSHEKLGPVFETNLLFPEKTNVHFCKILGSSNIKVKVWERGAGSTLACGTGACAIHVAAFKLGFCNSRTEIQLPGGNLIIDWADKDEEVLMTGGAEKIFSGSIDLI
tara:strand:+ start:1374 stop:2237 length:864 start_codon:yes stop_codon:yes gene_type:complete